MTCDGHTSVSQKSRDVFTVVVVVGSTRIVLFLPTHTVRRGSFKDIYVQHTSDISSRGM